MDNHKKAGSDRVSAAALQLWDCLPAGTQTLTFCPRGLRGSWLSAPPSLRVHCHGSACSSGSSNLAVPAFRQRRASYSPSQSSTAERWGPTPVPGTGSSPSSAAYKLCWAAARPEKSCRVLCRKEHALSKLSLSFHLCCPLGFASPAGVPAGGCHSGLS